ncbi:MAG: EAL domain-containing protein [Gammaproteobacteria bacterium]
MTVPANIAADDSPAGTRVCMVISDRSAGDQLVATLAPKGITCSVVGTVTEAARSGAAHDYDLLVLDAEVYGPETVDACQRLAENWPQCPLIVLADEAISEQELEQAGVARVIPLAAWQREHLPLLLAMLLENFLASSDLEAFQGVLRAVLENIEDGIVLMDRQGLPLLSNHAARKLLDPGKGHSQSLETGTPPGNAVREIPLTDRSGLRFGGMLHVRPPDDDAEVRAFEPSRDPLTGLVGAGSFKQTLARTLARRQRDGGRCAVLLLDLDRFRAVRDTLGAGFADRVIASMASAAANGMRRGDLIARMARDEFAVLIDSLEQETELVHVARKLLQLVRRAARDDSRWPDLTASIGIAVSPNQGESAETMLEAADHALCQAKAQGGNCYSFCSEVFQQTVSRYLDLHLALQGALARDEFSLHYQPIVGLVPHRISGFEGLLRWNSPSVGEVPPSEFVPILERTGMIQTVGEWVLHSACQEAKQLQQRFARPDLTLSINLSVRQIQEDSLVGIVRRALESTGLESKCLILEVTESLLMTEPEKATHTLQRLAMLGVGISIDDFGTGYSSLSYIKTLPVSGLKIDRVFLKGVPENPRDVSIVKGTLALAHSLGLRVTAEGVESMQQLQKLEALGCDLAQGFLLGRPASIETAANRLATDPR